MATLAEADTAVNAAKKDISSKVGVACLLPSQRDGIDNQFATQSEMASLNTNSPFDSAPRIINKKNYYTLVAPP